MIKEVKNDQERQMMSTLGAEGVHVCRHIYTYMCEHTCMHIQMMSTLGDERGVH